MSFEGIHRGRVKNMNKKPNIAMLSAVLVLGLSIAAWASCTPAHMAVPAPGGCQQITGMGHYCVNDDAVDYACGDKWSNACHQEQDPYQANIYPNAGQPCSLTANCGTATQTEKHATNSFDLGTACGA